MISFSICHIFSSVVLLQRFVVPDSCSCGFQVLPEVSRTRRSIIWELDVLVGGLIVGSEWRFQSCLIVPCAFERHPNRSRGNVVFHDLGISTIHRWGAATLRGMQRKHIFLLTFIYLCPSVSHPLSARRESCFVDRGHLSANGSDVMRLVRLDRPHFKNRPKGQCISIASIQTWRSFPWLRPSMGDPILEKPNHQPLIHITFIMPGFILHFSHLTCYWAQTISSRSQFKE